MAQTTGNTSAFIEASQYSQFILNNLKDGLLPESFYRNVSDFGSGTTLNIKTIGTATLQEVQEDQALTYNAIDTGNVQLTITDYIGDAWYITDVLRQDGAQVEALLAQRAVESTRAIQENVETRFLQAADAAQAAGDNDINGFSHRQGATGTNGQLVEADLISMALAFDKANVPMAGRIGIVDPIVGATFNNLVTVSDGLDRTPFFEEAFHSGFIKEHKFIGNIFGWNLFSSNRLPTSTAVETLTTGVTASKAIGTVNNLFMSVLDDNTRPMMMAWRQQPKTETERNKDHQRDEFLTTARWGIGAQRVDSLGVIKTSPTARV